MSVEQLLAPRSLAFGSVADGLWGAAWLRSPTDGGRKWALAGDTHRLTIAAGPNAATIEATLSDGGPERPWRVTAEGTELVLTPSSPGLAELSSDAHDPGLDQICQVEGQVTVGGIAHSVACLGWRGSGGPSDQAGRVASFRQLAAWFAPGDGMALLAMRPRSAKGQDQDTVTAVILDPEQATLVAEPRLSTTFDAQGRPVRAGLELWLGGEEEEQHSRRAAGEVAVSQLASWRSGALELQAQLFRWHSAGRDGAGVYLTGTLR